MASAWRTETTLLIYTETVVLYVCPGSAALLVQMKSRLIKSCRAGCCDEDMQLGQRGCGRESGEDEGSEAEIDQEGGKEKAW